MHGYSLIVIGAIGAVIGQPCIATAQSAQKSAESKTESTLGSPAKEAGSSRKVAASEALVRVGERAAIGQKVFLVVNEVTEDALNITWINDGDKPVLLEPARISAVRNGRSYTAIAPFPSGEFSVSEHAVLAKIWLAFPAAVRPLNSCVLCYGQKRVIDLRKRPH